MFNFIVLKLLILVPVIKCDIYLHNPRGSNNRLDESNIERDNDNRLFDSQNNERGGYNVGNMYYYTDSKLQIEWTNQHSCASKNANCDIILQYMCDDSLRDGSDTRTIPPTNSQCESNNCDTDYRFGMNENNGYYSNCRRRNRNKGLFTANQNLGNTAVNTRQNPGGKQYGYECPEERDYYPYWHPSPWIDIAILTNSPEKCEFYRNESENVKSRWYCVVPNTYQNLIPNNQNECEKININGDVGIWKESKPLTGNKPMCMETQYTRDNHLGNTLDGNPPVYNWTLPSVPASKCVLRIRYNVSTNDFSSATDHTSNVNNDLAQNFKLNPTDAKNRGYVFKNNPEVQLFPDLDFKLTLAIDVAQYGRVFQDRSHVFEIRKRPSDLENKKIVNLNVRGKRGNIVQVYPAVEYDFVPNKLELSLNDYVHIQWTGSNKNPPNNDGQGTRGTDRSNILLLSEQAYSKGNKSFFSPLALNGQYGRNYPMHLSNSSFLNLDKDSLTKLALLNQYGGSMDELDDAGTYFDLGPKKITKGGVVYHYMSSRNNNFSNRDQKGEIIVYEYPIVEQLIGSNGGTITSGDLEIQIPAGKFDHLTNIRIEMKSKDQVLTELEILKQPGAMQEINEFASSTLASDFLEISLPKNSSKPIPIETTLKLKNPPKLLQSTSVYRFNSDFLSHEKINIRANECPNKVTFEISRAGVYIARNESSYTVLIVCLVVILSLVAIGLFVGLYFWRNPKYLERIRYSACNVKRSMSDQI